MRLGIQDELLVKFALCYRDEEFATGYSKAPSIGVQTEPDLTKEMDLVRSKSEAYQDGYYMGTCFKNKSSRLHKLGMRKLKQL